MSAPQFSQHCFRTASSYADFGLVTVEESPVTCLRNGQKLSQPLAFVIDPEVCYLVHMFLLGI